MFNTYMTRTDIYTKHHVMFHKFTDDIQLMPAITNPMMSDELENTKQLLIKCIAEIRASTKTKK